MGLDFAQYRIQVSSWCLRSSVATVKLKEIWLRDILSYWRDQWVSARSTITSHFSASFPREWCKSTHLWSEHDLGKKACRGQSFPELFREWLKSKSSAQHNGLKKFNVLAHTLRTCILHPLTRLNFTVASPMAYLWCHGSFGAVLHTSWYLSLL